MATAGQMDRVVNHLRRAVLGGADDVTDGQLLETFLSEREQAAFAALVQRHGSMVLAVCRRVLQHAQDAEDAFQATFLVLVRKAGSLVNRHTIGDWLYGVAYHTALKARAAALKRQAREREAAEMAQPKPLEDMWQELRPVLDRELNRLPECYRAPVVLCDLEGKTRKQAAQQLGWPEGTVSGRLSRARVILAKRLTRQGLAFSGGALAALLSQSAASACVPASLASAATKAAILTAAGQTVFTGVISAQVASLTEGVIKTMFLTKLKITTVVLLTVGLAGTGAGIISMQTTAAERRADGVVVAAADDGQRRDGDKIKKGDEERKRESDKRDGERKEGERRDADRKEGERREGDRKDGDRREGDRKEGERRDRGPGLLPPGIERLELNESQKEKLTKLHKAAEEKMAAAQKKHMEAIQKARESQDRAKIEEAVQDLRKETGKIQEELHKQLHEILTDEQKRQLGELQQRREGGRPGPELLPRLLGQLDLNAEQREKIEKIMKEFGEKQEASQKKFQEEVEKAKGNQDREKVRDLFEGRQKEVAKMFDEVQAKVQEVLSEEQKRRFGELQRRGPGGPPPFPPGQILPPPLQERLGLTEEQRDKLAKLQKETEARLREILNEEQNRKLEEFKKGPGDRPRRE